MNRYLMLTSAAVLASTSANAGTARASFTFANNKGKAYCDGGTVYTSGSSTWAWQHINADCKGVLSNGSGRLGRQGSFKGADMSDNWYAILGYSSVALNYLLPAKIENHAKWQADIEFDGTTAFQLLRGTLIVSETPQPKSTTSTTSAVNRLIGAHRASR